MKEITIRNNVDVSGKTGRKNKCLRGFSVRWSDENDYAISCDLSSDFTAKPVDKKIYVEFWEKLSQINLQKVLYENEDYEEENGKGIVLEVSVGLHSLVLTLTSVDEEYYRRKNMTESLKLLNLINELKNQRGR